MKRKSCYILFYLLAHAFCIVSYSQQPPVQDTIVTDTIKTEVLTALRKRVENEIKKSIAQLKSDRIAERQNEVLDNILNVSEKAHNYLETGIDTAGIADQLDYALRIFYVAGDGIFRNKGSTQTERNLSTTSTLLTELLSRTETSKRILQSYLKNLTSYQNNIDSLSSDSILVELPSDSLSLLSLVSKITLVIKEMRPADTLLKKAIQKVQVLQTRVNLVIVELEDGIKEIETYRVNLSDSQADREMAYLWQPPSFRRPFSEIYHLSKQKTSLVLSFYSKNNSGKIVLLLAFIAALALSVRNLKKKLNAAPSAPEGLKESLVMAYPFLSSVFIVLCIFQFIFPEPPFVFSMLLWIVSTLSLTIIFRNYILKYWFSAWLIMLLMFFLAIIDNLILHPSRAERYGMLLLSLTAVAFGLNFLIGGRRKALKEKGIRVFMGFFILLELAATIANVFGRYNFSKSLLTSGIFGLTNAILFFWVIRLINEALTIAAQVYKTPGKKTLFVNFETVGQKAPAYLYYLLLVCWFVLFGRSFYFFRKITIEFSDFMTTERTVGESNFTLESVAMFFLILIFSGMVSGIVTFFASDDNSIVKGRRKSTGIGSWLLLIRISIISVGVLLAFSAAGIPMDKVAIILGALSVGIGFGLQALINNLVSGLILAFEKPLNVGDVVEFGGQSGTMKSIGFRSSIITTWDGADVIIPNGKLLDDNIINWTKSSSNRRVELVTGVAYGADLAKTKELLIHLVSSDERIIPFPKPLVLIHNLDSNTIAIRVLFWIENYTDTDWTRIRSDLIEMIDEAFRQEGIAIPNPSQDLNIRSFIAESTKEQGNKKEIKVTPAK